MRLVKVFVFVVLGVALVAAAAWLGYREGQYDGRLTGRLEALQVSGLQAAVDIQPITLTITPIDPNTTTVLPTPDNPNLTLNVCERLSVTAEEVLVRAEPGLTTSVVAALPRETNVGVVCWSEYLLQGVAWVQIVVTRPESAVVTGWIPGQDIGYPMVCMEGRVKPQELAIHETDWDGSRVVQLLPAGTAVGIICNSARGEWVREYWVRVKVIVNGEIVLGWTRADAVL
jgi:hypothetical protein